MLVTPASSNFLPRRVGGVQGLFPSLGSSGKRCTLFKIPCSFLLANWYFGTKSPIGDKRNTVRKGTACIFRAAALPLGGECLRCRAAGSASLFVARPQQGMLRRERVASEIPLERWTSVLFCYHSLILSSHLLVRCQSFLFQGTFIHHIIYTLV